MECFYKMQMETVIFSYTKWVLLTINLLRLWASSGALSVFPMSLWGGGWCCIFWECSEAEAVAEQLCCDFYLPSLFLQSNQSCWWKCCSWRSLEGLHDKHRLNSSSVCACGTKDFQSGVKTCCGNGVSRGGRPGWPSLGSDASLTPDTIHTLPLFPSLAECFRSLLKWTGIDQSQPGQFLGVLTCLYEW